MSVPGRLHQVKKLRFFVTLAVVLFVVGLILFVPLPHHLRCSMVLMPENIETVWVKQGGMLKSVEVEPGAEVSKDQVLATMTNVELELQLAGVKNEIDEKQLRLHQMLSRSGIPGAMDDYDQIKSELANKRLMYNRMLDELQEMTIVSPIDGVVLDTPYTHRPQSPAEVEGVDSRSVLYGKHTNVSTEVGQRICEVAALKKWEAIVILTEHQVSFVKLNQKTKLKLYVRPDLVIDSKVTYFGETDLSIDRTNYDAATPGTPQRGPTQNRPPDLTLEMVSVFQQQELQYFARVPLPENVDAEMRIGLGGQARLYTGTRSLGQRIWWWINQNFRS